MAADLSAVFPRLARYSQDDATRCLCHAVHLDRFLRDYVLHTVVKPHLRAVCPAYGVDLVAVAGACGGSEDRSCPEACVMIRPVSGSSRRSPDHSSTETVADGGELDAGAPAPCAVLAHVRRSHPAAGVRLRRGADLGEAGHQTRRSCSRPDPPPAAFAGQPPADRARQQLSLAGVLGKGGRTAGPWLAAFPSAR